MSIRSEILVHWTRPRLDPSESLTNDRYIAHIKSIYAEGLRFSIPQKQDEVHGALGTWAIIPTIPMICFTELRLSDVEQHKSRYGELGIGFRRNWLMYYRGANPVFYVQNTGQGVVSTNLPSIISEIHKIDGLKMFLSFVKQMSEFSESPDVPLEFYDEMEWRMVLWSQAPTGVPTPKWVKWEDQTAYFQFLPIDVALIVAPNEETRKAILNDEDMKKFFGQHLPMMVDADSCNQF